MKDYQFEVGHLLEELESAADELMLLIAEGRMSGAIWLDATRRHFCATEDWQGLIQRARAASESRH
ncbi:hypothetical protein [Pseudomonas sp. TWRC1-2]|uniref:hypothetical protein n=1 Tax=Pseudomonas sp. TWRC1-2 TaxID=2804628 RepID=UPI003CE90E59